MKNTILTALALSFTILSASGMGMLSYKLGIQVEQIVDQPFSGTAKTDVVSDNSTIGFELYDDFSVGKWSFRTKHDLTGSLNLNGEYDLKPGMDLKFRFQMFSKLNPAAVKYMVVQGASLKDVYFDYEQETIDITVQPALAAKTTSFTTAGQAGLGIDFYYNGRSEDLSYGVPLVLTDAYLDDTAPPAHPSSATLKGVGIRIDGMNNEPVTFDFLVGERFTMHHGIQFHQMMGYVDGVMPPSGFSMSAAMAPGFTANFGQAGETFKLYRGQGVSWSAHDIQLGVFPEPLSVTTFSKDRDGFHLLWNPESGKTYTIESTDDLKTPFGSSATNQSGPEYIDPNPGSSQRFYRIREE